MVHRASSASPSEGAGEGGVSGALSAEAVQGSGGSGDGIVAFTSDRDGNHEIYVVRDDGRELRRLTFHDAADVWATWSPDGEQIAFVSDRDGNDEIYLMDADGSHLRRFTFHPARDGWPAWSPDGTQLAFASNRDGNLEIYLQQIDGTGSTRLTDSASQEYRPSWSPDGGRLVFHARGPRGRGPTAIFAMNVDGSGRFELSDRGSGAVWSPDGALIAFDAERGEGIGIIDIFVMNADGGGRRRITRHDDHDEYPSWSPDGSKIAFESDVGGNDEVFTIRVDGSNRRRLTHNDAYDGQPSYSPRLEPVSAASGTDRRSPPADPSAVDGPSPGFQRPSRTAPLAGPYLGQQPPGETPELFAPGVISTCKEHSAAMFTPDGSEVYFGRMFPQEIYLMRQINGVWTDPEVAPFSGAVNDLYPFLSTDGQFLVFSSNRTLEPGGASLGRGLHLWMVERTASGWSEPTHIELAVDPPGRLGGPAILPDRTLYFGQRVDSGSMDIFVAAHDGHGYGVPRSLGPPINSEQPEHSPFLAPDRSFLLFSSFYRSRGRSDLFVSFRGADGGWTRPINLGQRVNSRWKDEYPYVSPDGKYLFFNSNRPSALNESAIPDGPGNVYWVDASVIERLRPAHQQQ